jgi:threonine/homoserine/homoserine lactone efflux protein
MDPILFIKGAIAGFIIAAPVGPVGILCVQRTLGRSIIAGLIAGSGAAVADAIFGGVAAFGLTFIAEFLQRHDQILRFCGGVLLIGLGLHGFFQHPNPELAPAGFRGPAGDAVSTFVLTITNPITILTFSPAFLAVGAVVAPDDRAGAGILILGVFAGSCLWWLVLCALTELLRRRLSKGRLRVIYRSSAIMILFFGAVVLVSGTPWGERVIAVVRPLML